MSAQTLDKTTRSRYDLGDVIGVHADRTSHAGLHPDAVEHIAVLAQPMTLRYNDTAAVHHMGPTRHYHVHQVGACSAHIIGQIDGITPQERLELLDEIEDLKTRKGRLSYCVLPHFHLEHDQKTGIPIAVKCSCVGMVVRAIEEVTNRTILDLGDPSYPDTPLNVLQQIYPPNFLARRHRAGLQDPGPWKAVLPGHLLHALKVGQNGKPFVPNPNDYLFP